MFAREKKRKKKRDRKRERYIENERRWKSWSSVLRNRVWRSPAIIASRELSSNYRWARLNVRSALSPRDRPMSGRWTISVPSLRNPPKNPTPCTYQICVRMYICMARDDLSLSLSSSSPFYFLSPLSFSSSTELRSRTMESPDKEEIDGTEFFESMYTARICLLKISRGR